ncbi:UDP-N-acetylglucosamine 2-epimerase [Halobacillus salinus]|uniref:UDP-N-acetylglucosamine 2-epimerase (Hydrolyzing) n=1 Tax=Halobacillus salinus TaxID=192814 RepID=A0A4Z0GZM6_9BACI|nr:UDP-N-acetylglucosamine 2-epimerase [Halobacillus salinus]TGB02730.1 UDP-N-acetylglucosamine 2-epimerase (hydrolyzing) [Halobacillus salinus]
MKRNICVVTGTRAEYGLLYWLMKQLNDHDQFQLQVIATGMHLSPEFGLTYQGIEEDGFLIDEKIEMLLSSDTPRGIAKSIGLGTIGFGDAFARLQPDLVVVLGDRFELLAAAQAALVARIPIAHLCGGDTTEGAYDESIRHCLTKMSHLHFVTTEASRKRVLQMGENPDHVFKVGYPGLDYIRKMKLLTKRELEGELGFQFRYQNLLITFHPVTLEAAMAEKQCRELLEALASLDEEYGLLFTMPNADNEGRGVIQQIQDFVSKRENAVAYTSLGQKRYLSAMKYVDLVVGNSSSGLSEAPSFKIATINIGERQKGRLQAESVLNCAPIKDQILSSIKEGLKKDCSQVINPYGDGYSTDRIIHHLEAFPSFKGLLKKHFFER